MTTFLQSLQRFITKLGYLGEQTWLGIRRGGWMTTSALSTVTVLLFLLGLSLQSSWQLDQFLNKFGSQVEISVYLQRNIQGEQIASQVSILPEVQSVRVVSKEEAWTALLSDLGVSDVDLATEQLEDNPLVDELRIQVKSATVLPEVAQKVKEIKGVDDVVYLNSALQRLRDIQKAVNQISFVLVSLLSVTAIAVITTTIRLIVTSRRQEIEIMQLVGATPRSIKLPFWLQGMGFGVVGGAIAWAILILLSQSLQQFLSQQPAFIQVLTQGLQLSFIQQMILPLVMLLFGLIVGWLGSSIALKN